MSGKGANWNSSKERQDLIAYIKSVRYKFSSAQLTFVRKIEAWPPYLKKLEAELNKLQKDDNKYAGEERIRMREELNFLLASVHEISKEIEGVTGKVNESISKLKGMDTRIEEGLLTIGTALKARAKDPQTPKAEVPMYRTPPQSPPKEDIKTPQDLKKARVEMPKTHKQDSTEKPQKLEKADRDQLLKWYADGREITIECLRKNKTLYPKIRSNFLTLHNKMVLETGEMLKSSLDKVLSRYIKETLEKDEGKFKNKEECMRLFCRFMAESKERNQTFYLNHVNKLKELYENTQNDKIKKICEDYFPQLRTT